MGEGLSLHCGKCGFKQKIYLGVGFAYPKLYEQTLEEIREGEYGESLRELLAQHPDAAVDPTLVLAICPHCGIPERVCDLSVYLPKPGYDPSQKPRTAWCMAMPCLDIDYVTPWDMREHYTLLRRFDHRCRECGAALEIVPEEEIWDRRLRCPECGGELSRGEKIMWD